MEIVNIVSSGDTDTEINLNSLSEDINLPYVKYNPENFSALMIRFEIEGPTILLFRSGKYTITGASSHAKLNRANRQFLKLLSKFDIVDSDADTSHNVVNIVFTADLKIDVDLVNLLTVVGFENTEYEPEQSPFMVYRPDNNQCVITIAGSGKIVINGAKDVETAEKAFEDLQNKIKDAGLYESNGV